MTTIELVIVGMWAIVTDKEMNCATQPPGRTEVNGFSLVATDPGWPAEHEPVLWVRRDSFGDLPEGIACYRNDKKSSAYDCENPDEPTKRWLKYPLRGMKLSVTPEAGATSHLRTGARKVESATKCWAGRKKNDPGACDTDCSTDASWIPEYRKGNGNVVVDPKVITKPEDFSVVSAVATGLTGELQASGDPGYEWKWKWNYDDCKNTVEDYQSDYDQYFNTKAKIVDTRASKVKLGLFGQTATELELESNAFFELHNYPKMQHAMRIGNDVCLIPHYEMHHELLKNPPNCRRIPYWVIPGGNPGGKPCIAEDGEDDPVCPPTILKGG